MKAPTRQPSSPTDPVTCARGRTPAGTPTGCWREPEQHGTTPSHLSRKVHVCPRKDTHTDVRSHARKQPPCRPTVQQTSNALHPHQKTAHDSIRGPHATRTDLTSLGWRGGRHQLPSPQDRGPAVPWKRPGCHTRPRLGFHTEVCPHSGPSEGVARKRAVLPSSGGGSQVSSGSQRCTSTVP